MSTDVDVSIDVCVKAAEVKREGKKWLSFLALAVFCLGFVELTNGCLERTLCFRKGYYLQFFLKFLQSDGGQILAFRFIRNIVTPVRACDPFLLFGVVAAEC